MQGGVAAVRADREELQEIVHVDCSVTGDVLILCARRRRATEGRKELEQVIDVDHAVARLAHKVTYAHTL